MMAATSTLVMRETAAAVEFHIIADPAPGALETSAPHPRNALQLNDSMN